MRVVSHAAITSASLTLILSCAAAFNWLLTSERIPVMVSELITGLIATKWVFLLALNVLLIAMGCFLDLIAMILVLGPILLPTLNSYGIDLVHFGIIMIVNAEVGFMTPPFGVNIFVAMGVTKQTFWEVARAVFPFMLLFLGCLLAITYLPQISTFLPDLFFR